jgi:hypothetical protein
MPHSAYLGEVLQGRQIRLLRLLPARKWEDDLHCTLSSALLGDNPLYQAVSYAWGLSSASRAISINGFKYLVTPNLETALRRIRDKALDVVLWVDAICKE